ncbi:FixH family protein [Salibacterium halotolerans]|uniref:YtkA-like n=1 Tax=Salibacterium halotolerans TaxID=1884432 RepID=A0A1I5TWL1_9BACI|nr:FixH family protein [Salibacterium halotolerans]SFP86706.1 YtkA-like [Salibacterium halotolerans]
MKGLYAVSAVILTAGILTACGQGAEEESGTGGENTEVQSIGVKPDMPDNPESGTEVELAASVTQGDEAVTDADEVRFEIWKDGAKENSEEILSENREENRYSIPYTFEEEGVYHVTSHVTARDMHNMPTTKVTVGDAETESGNSEENADTGGQEQLGVTVQSQDITVGQPSDVSVKVQHEGEALTGADVTFDLQTPQGGSAVQLETEESGTGVYTGTHIFEAAGEYTLTVHAQTEDGLNEHAETVVTAAEYSSE